MNMMIQFRQVEESRLPTLKSILNQDYAKYYNLNRQTYNTNQTKEFIDSFLNGKNTVSFLIEGHLKGQYQQDILGFCSLYDIKPIVNHANVLFFMSDKHGKHLELDFYPEAQQAMRKLLDVAFNQLNLQKISIEVPYGLMMMEGLNKIGFIAEGVRKYSRMIDGVQVSTTVFSLLKEEFL